MLSVIVIELLVIATGAIANWQLSKPKTPADMPKANHPSTLLFFWFWGGPIYLAIYAVSITIFRSVSDEKDDLLTKHLGQTLLFAFLTIGPVLYFLFETVWLFGRENKPDEYYKWTQELSSRIWATLTVLLGFYWFHNLR